MREWLAEILIEFEGDAEEDRERNEWRAREEPNFSGDDTFGLECCDAFHRMVAAQECEIVWRALERRCDPAARRSKEIFYEQGRESARSVGGADIDECHLQSLGAFCLSREDGSWQQLLTTSRQAPTSKNIKDMARDLFGAVAEIRGAPIPDDTMAKRRARLQVVEATVEKLRDALAPLWSESMRVYGGRYQTQDKAIDRFATNQLDRWLRQIDAYGFAGLDPESVAIAYQAGREVTRNPLAFLDALVDDTREWAEEKPELARPNDLNAARLMFIRKLTAYFRESYGEALRACVLAIASVFFDCSTLDESAIAKLAP